uniref:BTB domain-containing protein n=1 Tax=Panagrolaimus sp. PS1159 TaxID=55785 RepID=A0AC35FSI5_9BILA
MFNAATKMNKPKPKKGFNLFDNDTSSDDDKPPKAPTKNLPRFADTTTSSVPSHPYASLAAAENFMTKNFSAKPCNAPESKPPNVKDAIAQHIDDEMKQEPIIPRSSVQPGDCAGQYRQRFIRPSTTSGECNMPDSGESSSSQASTHFDNITAASTSRVDASQLHRATTSSVEQQTDATPRETDISGGDKLGMALYALPDKDFSFKLKNGEMISIHKNVLAAQSPYFFQQFYGNPGSSIDTLLVDDFDPAVISLAVKACYQQPFDENALDGRIAEQLYNFAMKYDIGYVKALLPETSTKNIISADTVCSIALRSYETNDLQLRQKCATFIASLITEGKEIPDGIHDLPADFDKAIVLAIATKSKI